MLFDKGLEGKAKELYDKLYTVDFDPVSLRKELENGKYDAETVNISAIEFVDDCGVNFNHWDIDFNQFYPGETVPGEESSHMTEAIRLLLDFGLDPNKIFRIPDNRGSFDEYNIMEEVGMVFNGHQAADSLYLLLSHGGDPYLTINRISLSTDPDWDIGFDTINREDMVDDSMYEAKLHYWMVLVGFRAARGDANLPVDPIKGFDLSKLQEHRNYYAGAIHSDKSEDNWELCIFDKRTNWEVARF